MDSEEKFELVNFRIFITQWESFKLQDFKFFQNKFF